MRNFILGVIFGFVISGSGTAAGQIGVAALGHHMPSAAAGTGTPD